MAQFSGFSLGRRPDESGSDASGRVITWGDSLSAIEADRSRIYWAITGFFVLLTLVEADIAWPVGGNLWDFGAFLGVGRAIREGVPPYFVLNTTPLVLVNGSLVPWPNTNPPALLPVLYLASLLSPLTAFRSWFVVCLVLYICLVGFLLQKYSHWRTPFGIAVLCAFLPFWASEERGQIYVPLALLTVAAWFDLASGRYRRAGILLGVIVALKPNFAIWPGVLLLTGYATTGLWAAFVAVVLSAIPALLYGPDIYLQWFEAIKIGETVDMRIVSSVFSVGAIFGRPDLTTTIGIVLSVGLIATLGLWALRTRPGVVELSAAAIITVLLVGPITWHGYGLLALPVLLSRRWSWTLIAALAASFLPYNIVPFFALVGVDIIRRGSSGYQSSPVAPVVVTQSLPSTSVRR